MWKYGLSSSYSTLWPLLLKNSFFGINTQVNCVILAHFSWSSWKILFEIYNNKNKLRKTLFSKKFSLLLCIVVISPVIVIWIIRCLCQFSGIRRNWQKFDLSFMRTCLISSFYSCTRRKSDIQCWFWRIIRKVNVCIYEGVE